MGKQVHILKTKDTVNKIGDCANCGTVKIRLKGSIWRCSIGFNTSSRGVKGKIRPKPELCEICHRKKRLVADHDHETGLFRGWLCHSCNFMLGRFNDDPNVLRRALAYLKRTKVL